MSQDLPEIVIVERYENDETEAGIEFRDEFARKSDNEHPIEMRPAPSSRNGWYEAWAVPSDPLFLDDYIERTGIVDLVSNAPESMIIVGHAQIAQGEYEHGHRMATVFVSLFFETEEDAVAFRLAHDGFDYEDDHQDEEED